MPHRLSPFLALLEAQGFKLCVDDYRRIDIALGTGGEWTLDRLRDVLLVLLAKDQTQREIFLKQFGDFFSSADVRHFQSAGHLNINAILQEIHSLKPSPPPKSFFKKRKPSPDPSGLEDLTGFSAETQKKKTDRLRWLIYPLLSLLIIATAGLHWLSKRPMEIPLGDVTVTRVIPDTPPKDSETVEIERPIEPPFPVIKIIQRTPPTPKPWKQYIAVFSVLLLSTLLCGFYIWKSRKVPKDKPPAYDAKKPRRLPLENLGGPLSPRLDDETLCHLADSIGYFQSDKDSHVLNVPASIKATGDCGGIPALRFFQRRQLRKLIILVDELAEALAWNPVPRELYHGLSRLGISCVYGRFRGSPTQFIDAENRPHFLDDLDSQREGLIVLVFSDGKGLNGRRDAHVLEMLSHWQNLAWLELRARPFWDEGTALAAHYGMPLYAADREGLLLAFRRFLSESGSCQDASLGASGWRGALLQGDKDLGFYLESFLGEALPLAQACSMMQPLSLGMVDGVRRTFFAGLPPASIELLLKMPRCVVAANGVRFASDVQAVLRRGFLLRFAEDKQERILLFFAEALQALKPAEEDSLAFLQWQLRYQRVRLELEPDAALQQLSALAQSPLKNALALEFENVVLAGNAEAGVLPLRKDPASRDGRQRLGQLAVRSGIKAMEAYPVRWGHKLVLLCLLIGWLVGGIFGVRDLGVSKKLVLSFDKEYVNALFLSLEVNESGKWRVLETADYSEGLQWFVDKGKEYRLLMRDMQVPDVAQSDKVMQVEVAGLESRLLPFVKELGVVNDNLQVLIEAKKERVFIDRFVQDKLKIGGLAPKMVFIKGGTFMMGSPESEPQRGTDEKQHSVTVGNFYIGQYEVTFADYDVFAKETKRKLPDDDGWGRKNRPVINVSWHDAVAYAEWLSEQTGQQYRLPTEAEWEYAARAGTTTAYSWGDDIDCSKANYGYDDCKIKQTKAVGSYAENAFNLYDMHGNVWEWTCSEYDENYANKEIQCLSKNNAKMRPPVIRGGSWYYNPRWLRSASRYDFTADIRYNNLGFRLVRM